MTRIYIDGNLKKYILPYEMRENSKADGKTFTTGTRIPLPSETKVIRLFTAWGSKSGEASNIDVDLGANFIKETSDGELIVESISYYNQTSKYAVHSGDFTSCMKYNKDNISLLTAEYLDIDINEVRNQGFRYILTGEFIYSGADDYDSINAWSGVTLLDELRTTKKQKTNIKNALFKMKLSGKYQAHMAIAIDVITNEIVIMDEYTKERSGVDVGKIKNKMNEYKKLIFNAVDFQENMFDFINKYCVANEDKFVVVNDYKKSDIIVSYNVFKDLKEEQTQFNVSDNLEKIIGLLS